MKFMQAVGDDQYFVLLFNEPMAGAGGPGPDPSQFVVKDTIAAILPIVSAAWYQDVSGVQTVGVAFRVTTDGENPPASISYTSGDFGLGLSLWSAAPYVAVADFADYGIRNF
jgi:hypothetical protein